METKLNSSNKEVAIAASVLLFIAAFAYSCSSSTGKENKKEAAVVAKPQGVPVDAVVIKATTLKEEMEVTGTLHANQAVSIMTELSRKVVSVYVKEGSFVAKGALLFKLDDADLRAQLEQLQQQEKLARLNEQRLKDLINHQAVMQQDYDQTLTNLKVLQAQVKQVRVQIEKTAIRAPFGGTIGIVNIYPGALVSPGISLATLNDNSKVKLDFSVPEKYTAALKTGDVISFNVQSQDRAYRAVIVAKESNLDNDTRSLLVRAIGENPQKQLIPGQSARLKIALSESENAIQVPANALMPSSQGYAVYVVSANKASIKPIQIGQRNATSVQVTGGLSAGDTVVTSNMLRIIPGVDLQLVTVKTFTSRSSPTKDKSNLKVLSGHRRTN